MNIGPAIKRLRIHKGLSQKEFASRIGISGPYLSQLESAKRTPSIDLANSICLELGVSLPLLVLSSMELGDFPEGRSSIFEILKPVVTEEILKLVDAS